MTLTQNPPVDRHFGGIPGWLIGTKTQLVRPAQTSHRDTIKCDLSNRVCVFGGILCISSVSSLY